jgi:hypothetical protein
MWYLMEITYSFVGRDEQEGSYRDIIENNQDNETLAEQFS